MSDYYDNLCPFCENNLLLTYFCEDCTSVFCQECVHFAIADDLICASCGSHEISMANMASLECKSCKSRHIASVQKQVKTCPNCSSNGVVKIVDKFDEMRNRFKRIITESKRFLSPLMYAVDTISIQREKLIRLREDSVKICHFPQLEMEILSIIKLFKDGKHAIQSKTSDFFQRINRNFKTYFEIEKSPPRLIPVLETELEDLEKSADTIVTYGNYTNEKLEEKFSDVRTKIELMSSIQRLFMRYLSILGMNINYNEKPVFGIRGKLGETSNPEVDHNIVRSGTILLTNQKLYFLQEKGVFKKKPHLILSLSLDELSRVRVKGLVMRKLVLEFGQNKYSFQLPKKNLAQLEHYIEKARVFDNNKIDMELLYGLKHTDVSIRGFRNALESAIISLIGYKTAILDSNDSFRLDNLYDASEFEHGTYNSHSNSYQQQRTTPVGHPQNHFQRQSSASQHNMNKFQQDNLTNLYDIYQKRPLPGGYSPPEYHQRGTISHPYNPYPARNSQQKYPPRHSENPSNSNYNPPPQFEKPAIKPRFPLRSKTRTGSIINNLMSVLPDEDLHIPQPPEVQKNRHVPEIDVSRLIPPKSNSEQLLRMEEKAIWLQRKLDILTQRRDRGKLSESEFLGLYEEAYRELYRTQKHIEEIKKKN